MWRKDNLMPHKSNTWASSAEAIPSFYWRGANPITIAGLQIDDTSGSRALFYDFKPICAGMNSQIKLKNGAIPEVGSILNISADVAKTFIPAIKAGAYPVLRNDNVGPWRLGAPMALISPNGAALLWALYVDDAAYDENSTDTIILEVGTRYQLRTNSPEAIAGAEYTISHPNSPDVVVSSADASTNFSANHRPTIAHLTNAAGSNGSITVQAGTWTKTFTTKLKYTQKGSVDMESGASFKAGATFAIAFGTDPLRTFSEAQIEVFDTSGTSVVAQSLATGTARSFVLTMPPTVGKYRLAVSMLYSDTTKPTETFSINFGTNA
jgi:hypothetical protein